MNLSFDFGLDPYWFCYHRGHHGAENPYKEGATLMMMIKYYL